MPGGDRTGPMGQGPMTGRRAGYCAGFAVPGHMNPEPLGFGRGGYGGGGYGRGGGRGYRRRNMFYATGQPGWARGGWGMDRNVPSPVAYAPPTTQDESTFLKEQADYFEQALRDIKKRLAELEGATGEGPK